MNPIVKQGRVMAIMMDPAMEEEVLIVKNDEETVYILSQEVGRSNAINYIGFVVEYVHDQVVEGRQYASVKKLQATAFTQLKAEFEANPNAEYQATVLQVEESAARLRLNHCIANLERYDLSPDPVKLSDLLKVGDEIAVRIKVIQKEYIQVEAVEKQYVKGTFDLSDLEEGDLVYGVVHRTKVIRKVVDDSFEKADHTFVTIARDVDALAPLQPHRPVEAGQEVVFKINQINSDGRVRGKILRVLSPKKESLKEQKKAPTAPQVGDTCTGRVKLIRDDYQLGEKVLILISQGQEIVVPYSELSGSDASAQEIGWLGAQITVKIIATGSRLLGSKRQKDGEDRQSFIAKWQENPEVIKPAYLKEIGAIGYILRIGREEVFLLKSDHRLVSQDLDESNINDKIYVRLKSVQGDIVNVTTALDFKEQELKKLGVTEEDFKLENRNNLPIYDGVITKLMKKGAYVEIDGVRVFLPNTLFSLGLTRVKDVHQVGDSISVKLYAYKDQTLVVRSNPRFIQESGLVLKELKPGMLACGVVRKICSHENPETGALSQQIFTSLGFKLEGLSPHSQYFDIEEGDHVIFRVNQIRENGSIRGRIVRVFA